MFNSKSDSGVCTAHAVGDVIPGLVVLVGKLIEGGKHGEHDESADKPHFDRGGSALVMEQVSHRIQPGHRKSPVLAFRSAASASAGLIVG